MSHVLFVIIVNSHNVQMLALFSDVEMDQTMFIVFTCTLYNIIFLYFKYNIICIFKILNIGIYIYIYN